MASSLEYLTYVLELLKEVDNIYYKKMIGEYILYCGPVIFGGVYDNRFLIKKTEYSSSLQLKEVIPYPTSRGMFQMDSEDPDVVKEIVENLVKDLA